jgi:hypothetical protein
MLDVAHLNEQSLLQVDVLKKFAELKDISNKKHLMHYLAEFCTKTDPSLCAISDEFADFEEVQ